MKLVRTTDADVPALLRGRRAHFDPETTRIVAEIVENVAKRGDAALLDSVRRFDDPQAESIWVDPASGPELDPEDQTALEVALDRIMRFHEAQLYYLTEEMDSEETGASRFEDIARLAYAWDEEGVGQRMVPLQRVGVYVPGGQAAYPSSVLMNVCPANVALVDEVLIATPRPAPAVLAAARMVHASRVLAVGGAAAVAAFALGTETVPRVDKVVGPGNRFVNEAKRQLWGQVGLDGYAGPSEGAVLADDTTNVRFAAADLITQIEHAEDNQAFLITWDVEVAEAILTEAEAQIAGAEREGILRAAWANGLAIVCRDAEEAVDIVNQIAPEHLSLAIQNPDELLPQIRNAGCILLGEHTPESAGDYLAGPSHTLPTATAARFGSPLNVLDFMKLQSVVRLDRETLEELAPTIERLARIEGFPVHGRGATIRFEETT